MKIDKNLNLVMEVEGDEFKFFVHSMAISRQVFEIYHLPIAKVFSSIYTQGLHSAAGPRVAKLMLIDAAKDCDQWDGPDGVENGLFNEIRRLTNVIVPSENGWATVPFDQAIKREMIEEESIAEIENNLAFFIVVSAMHRSAQRKEVLERAGRLWEWHVTLFNCTEYAKSLPTSMPEETTGEKADLSSIPS